MAEWLITRPAEDAGPLAAALAARGHAAVTAPVLTIRFDDPRPADIDGIQAVLVTSANGIRGLARITARRDLTVLAVGDATAAACRAAGFGEVVSASGAAADLAALAAARLDPAAGAVLHAAGDHVAGDLDAMLAEAGLRLRRLQVYHAEAVATLPAPAVAALGRGSLAGVLFFSPRTASMFARLVDDAGLTDRLASLTAVCLSGAVARRLDGRVWAAIRVADQPDSSSLMAVIDNPAGPLPSDRTVVRQNGMDPRPDDPRVPGTEQPDPSAQRAPEAAENAEAELAAPAPGEAPVSGRAPDVEPSEESLRAVTHEIAEIEAAATAGAGPAALDQRSARNEFSGPDSVGPAPAEVTVEDTAALDEPAPRHTLAKAGAPDRADRDEAEPVHHAGVAAPTPEPAPPAPSPSSGRGLAWLALLLALVALGGAASAPLWAPSLLARLGFGTPASTLDARVAALEARAPGSTVPGTAGPATAALADRLAAVEWRLSEAAPGTAAATGSGPDVEALNRRIAALEQAVQQVRQAAAAAPAAAPADLGPLTERVGAVERQAAQAQDRATRGAADLSGLADRLAAAERAQATSAELGGRVSQLSARVEELARQLGAVQEQVRPLAAAVQAERSQEMTAQVLILAIGQLRQAVASGQAYATALPMISALAEEDADISGALAPLQARAETGVPTRQALIAAFPRAAAAIRAAGDHPVRHDHWVDRTLSNLEGLVSVRRAPGEVPGNDTDAIVARAEQRVNDGRLTEAVRALSDLNGPAAVAAAPWLGDVQARIDADAALDTLSRHALERLAAMTQARGTQATGTPAAGGAGR